ncbi:MAG TPA: TetR family transcriptional regulator C-terminal domain-containing protein [Methylomirabilota bacterium]|nr:TetR family transcriptional regulator C-terminal domain-containing protein [Methylomirabilota bacterium]
MTPRLGVAPVRREQIVRATIRCLARDGYAGLTMKRVAGEAGVSQGILHYYFRDKAAMLAAAALRVTADLDRRVAAETRGARDARAWLRALIRACLRTAVEDRDFWRVFVEFWGEAFHDRRLATVNRRAYARARHLIGAGLTEGVTRGVLRPVAIEEGAAVTLALLDGLALQLTFDPELMTLPRATRVAETALFRYLVIGESP